MQNNQKNPAFMAMKINALEVSLRRQFALNGAAADAIIRCQDEIATLGSYVIALVKRLDGRAEFTVAELQEIAASDLEVNYSYPDEKRPTFVMVLSAKGAKPGDARTEEELEAKLREAGVSEADIQVAKDTAAAFVPEGAVDPSDLDDRGDSRVALVGPDGKPPEGA
jgi:hypothetical protein